MAKKKDVTIDAPLAEMGVAVGDEQALNGPEPEFDDMPDGLEETMQPAPEPEPEPHPWEGHNIWAGHKDYRDGIACWWVMRDGKVHVTDSWHLHPSRKRIYPEGGRIDDLVMG